MSTKNGISGKSAVHESVHGCKKKGSAKAQPRRTAFSIKFEKCLTSRESEEDRTERSQNCTSQVFRVYA